jgi:hypothetical protein
MTITARKVSTQLAASSSMLDNLAPRLVAAVTNAILSMSDPVPDDRPKADDAGIRSKGGHSDPTGDAALRGLAWDDRVFDLMEANLDTLKLALGNLTAFADHWAPRQPASHPRCNAGRDSVQPWARPDCENLVSYRVRNDGSTTLLADGLCDACRMRKHRANKDVA